MTLFTIANPTLVNNLDDTQDSGHASASSPTGEKATARALLTAIRTLHAVEQAQRPATPAERQALARFPGCGPVALRLFPDPVTGRYKDATWQTLGEELLTLLTPEDYASAKRTTFTAFYTAPVVVQAMHAALAHLGVPPKAFVLEPGCGCGNFMAQAPAGMRFLGVELDRLSGHIARTLYPEHDIRIENFRDTRLPQGGVQAVLGNVPFADLHLDYAGMRLALHDFFLAKSLDALTPGGVLALVTSHYTLDKQHPGLRQHLVQHADFLGAIRLPSTAFQQEGTTVVTDILCLRKRSAGEAPQHADPAWLDTAPYTIEGVDIPINRYFLDHPAMVLGTWSREHRLYASANTYSLRATGDLATQLSRALHQLPADVWNAHTPRPPVQHLPVASLPPAPLTEGSFFVDKTGAIHQITDGQPLPVTHGTTPLTATTPRMGRRLAALIALRDQARQVLHAQNEGWPETQRQAARHALNRLYDGFVATYGPINMTTITTTDDGTTTRRLPNLVKFRDDPDAMLVMALEHYDETTGTADKAAIMHHDVVGRRPPLTTVPSAVEGLLVSLDQRGRVDLPYIATLYQAPVAQIIAELGDLIYEDPDTQTWHTADVYLSGNVRAKLAAAERAGSAYARNVEALRAVQPEDVLPGDIDAHLGAPWIPASDIQAFAVMLFDVPLDAIQVRHLATEALWSLDGDHRVHATVAATTDYGTARVGGVTLLEQALNLKSPTIYDVNLVDGKETRVLNADETLAAREKQKAIKERFRPWLFADPERTERLVRVYNDTYNTIRLRRFDGAHLAFPGMNPHVTLRPHQKDAVWRIMSSGNTLLAHAVGAGKTFTMAAADMKLKQAGLVHKPLYVVPNHLLEQFGREFLQLYPNARLLMAGKEDVTRERRKLLTARIASGAWDGIITTHSAFERMGMSHTSQAQFLREQIAAYEELLCDDAAADTSGVQRNIIKALEKQKAKREDRLRALLAEDKKDDGLVFDELGIDHIFVDEAHMFKNLDTPTKMERVAGIQTTGSARAFDLFMKTRYLHQHHPGHGVTFATGTPISNTMVEMYTIQRYLDPNGLEERGLAHFDAWAATFGDVVETLEIAPDGKSLRPRSRFAKFVNLPELQQMFRSYADMQTAAMLDLPRPRLQGDKATVIACPMSEAQRTLQDALVQRYEAIRAGKVKPWEDNALAITSDGRTLALEARLLLPTAPDVPESKLNALVTNVAARHAADLRRPGVHPTPWGYAVYDDIVTKLVQQGVPRAQIACMGDADTDGKQQALFTKVRQGTIRILLGSTQKMGAGTNVQQRLVASHNLECPWKPSEVEQRDGRILRQGNTNTEVAIYRSVTQGSFDAFMWQALETKAMFIAQVLTGDSTVRQAEDIGGQELAYAEVKAIASGNPAVLTLAETDATLRRLHLLQKQHTDTQYLARRRQRDLPTDITRLEQRLAALTQDIQTAEAQATAPLTIGARTYPREQTLAPLTDRLRPLPTMLFETRAVPLGLVQGLQFGLAQHPQGTLDVYLEGALRRSTALAREVPGPHAVLNAVDRLLASAAQERDTTRRDLAIAQGPAPRLHCPPEYHFCPYGVPGGTHEPAAPARTGPVQPRRGRRGATHSRRPGRPPHRPARRPHAQRQPRARCCSRHHHSRRGDYHAHSPAGTTHARGRPSSGGAHAAGPAARRWASAPSRHARRRSNCACGRDAQARLVPQRERESGGLARLGPAGVCGHARVEHWEVLGYGPTELSL